MTHKNKEEPVHTSRRMRILVFGVILFAFGMGAVGEVRADLRRLKRRILRQPPQHPRVP